MSVKSSLIASLEKNIGKEVSGQDIAKALGVTRAAVWKAVKALQSEGYPITATRNKGYVLGQSSDIISPQGIRTYMGEEYKNWEIQVLKTVDSTITYGKAIAQDLGSTPGLVVALEQTAGIGRRGHSFYSPKDTGIYMSVILKPEQKRSTLITVAAALAVCNAIEEYSDKTPKIKWVNDIFVEGKKVCGILTQGIIDFETQSIETAVIGIGVNLSTDHFPDDVSGIATSVHTENVSKNQFIATIATKLFTILSNYDDERLIDEYKKRLFMLNQIVTYQMDGENRSGTAIDVNISGNLIVKTNSGTDTLTAGEISAKPSTFLLEKRKPRRGRQTPKKTI